MKEFSELDEELISLLNNRTKRNLLSKWLGRKSVRAAHAESGARKTERATSGGADKMLLNVLVSQAELLEELVNTDASMQ